MKIFRFKTNINCQGCIDKVTPSLDQLQNTTWNVDTQHKDKILTIESDEITAENVINMLEEIGFSAQLLTKKRFGLF